MEEQIRQKYEFLLSEPEEQKKSKVRKKENSEDRKQADSAKQEKNKFSIGHHLRRMRLWKGLSLDQAAQGICKKRTLERMERGQEESFSGFDRHFLLRSLLNRMGMFTGKFEFYYDAKERQREAVRKWLVDWRKIPQEKQTGFLKELHLPEDATYEDALESYEAAYRVEWERVWVSWQKRIWMLSQGISSEETSMAWKKLCMQKLFYTQEEWEFLYALAAYFQRREESKKAGEVYRQMYQNATASGIDDERQLELLPELCLTYGKFLWEHEVPKNRAENILMHGIRLNLKFRRLYFLYDLMETYCTILYSRLSDASKENLRKKVNWKDAEEKEIITELLQYESYLVALEMARKKQETAKKRMIFMKEELGWEGSTLDYTYDVLGRH